MGYDTTFDGELSIEPPLNDDEISYLSEFAGTRHVNFGNEPLNLSRPLTRALDPNNPPKDMPGLWCQWVTDEQGTLLEWDGREKFYEAEQWMTFVIRKLLSPTARDYIDEHKDEDVRLGSFTCDHVLNGTIDCYGEDPEDRWRIQVVNNEIEIHEARVAWPDEDEVDEEEVREIIRELKGVSKVRLWTLAFADEVSDSSIQTLVFATEQECYDSLRTTYAQDHPNISDADLVDLLTEQMGVVFYIEEHTVEAPLA